MEILSQNDIMALDSASLVMPSSEKGLSNQVTIMSHSSGNIRTVCLDCRNITIIEKVNWKGKIIRVEHNNGYPIKESQDRGGKRVQYNVCENCIGKYFTKGAT